MRGTTPAQRHEMRHQAWLSALRASAVFVVLSLLYVFAPFGEALHTGVLVQLVGMFIALVAVTVWEFRNIARSAYPEFRAIEAVAVTIPLLLLPFASTYYVMSRELATSFNEHLSRLDALYFTLTTFSTVGYGDIVARSEPARAAVTAQIVLDLVLIGLIGRALFGAVQRRRESLRTARESGGEPNTRSEIRSPALDSDDR
ncbi:MAG TPA: potassium channel family protein [Jatrophihabitans sp.]|nr:potassium channel family protein [Jatrophihabitans sp.]